MGKLNRLCDVTVPAKLNLLDELIEKTSEQMIDEEESIGAVQSWITDTQGEFQEAFELYEKGKALLNANNTKLNDVKTRYLTRRENIERMRGNEC